MSRNSTLWWSKYIISLGTSRFESRFLFRTSPALSIVAQLDDAIVVFEPYNATVHLWDHLQEFPVQVQTLDSIKEKRLFAKSFKISSRWLPMCVGE